MLKIERNEWDIPKTLTTNTEGKGMPLFELHCLGERKFRYAVSDGTFLRYDYTSCPDCGRSVATPVCSGDARFFYLSGGKQYPDLLPFNGAGTTKDGGRFVIISEKAKNAFECEGITGYSNCTKVSVVPDQRGTDYDTEDAPNYYLIDIDGRIDLDFAKMNNLRRKKYCQTCGQFEWSQQRMHRRFVDVETWSQNDLCRIKSLPGFVVCSEKVMDAAEKYKLTNFEFVPFREKG